MARQRAAGRVAIVAGATGLVGRELVRELVKGGGWGAVHALGRRPSGIEGVRDHVVDLDALTASDLPDADDLFCCLGTTLRRAGSAEAFRRVDLDYVLRLARAGRERGIGRFLLVSSMGADARSPVLYSRTKGEVEQAVRELGYPSTEIVRPSFLVGERAESRPVERAVVRTLSLARGVMGGPLRKYAPIAATDVARALVAIARDDVSGVRLHLSDELAARAGSG